MWKIMVIAIRFTINRNKSAEFFLTLQGLQDVWKKKKALLKSHFYKDLENENTFCLIQEWTSRQDLKVYMRSEDFGVLLGAIRLLARSSCFRISSPLSAQETEMILAFQQDQTEDSPGKTRRF
jgi:quinol monooxygenase YgiN